MSYLVGVDTGGTFTDFALYDTDTHLFTLYKRPSTPDDPSDSLIRGLRELLSQERVSPDTVTGLAHGTTVATNALIQDRLGDVGMITTAVPIRTTWTCKSPGHPRPAGCGWRSGSE